MVIFDHMILNLWQFREPKRTKTVFSDDFPYDFSLAAGEQLRAYFIARQIPVERIRGYVVCSLGPLPFEKEAEKLALYDAVMYFESALHTEKLLLPPVQKTWDRSVPALVLKVHDAERVSMDLIYRHLLANKALFSPREGRIMGRVLSKRSWWNRTFSRFDHIVSKEKVNLLLARLRAKASIMDA